jgi:hypothetical protein
VLITPVSKVGEEEEGAEETHVDPRGGRTVVVDHMKVVRSFPVSFLPSFLSLLSFLSFLSYSP